MSSVRVWIDQDLCTGDGICEEITPDLFGSHSDGLWYVKSPDMADIYVGTETPGEPKYQMGDGTVEVPENLIDSVIESAEECPGECIMLDVID